MYDAVKYRAKSATAQKPHSRLSLTLNGWAFDHALNVPGIFFSLAIVSFSAMRRCDRLELLDLIMTVNDDDMSTN